MKIKKVRTPLLSRSKTIATAKAKDKKIDITILMNFHKEGFLAQTSILSAMQAKEYFIKSGMGTVSAVAILDSADEQTKRVIYANQSNFDLIEEVAYRDLAKARNHGISCADGKYIAFLDGDDLWGESWLYKAYSLAQKNPSPAIYHTEYFIGFGRENFARIQWDSEDPEFDPLTLMQNWHFCNNLFSEKSILTANPFISYDHDSGFGSEDWHWSCETLARGIRHAPVPETAYFYRMRADTLAVGGDSHLGLGAKVGLLVRPSDLFMPGSLGFDRKAYLLQDLFIITDVESPHRLKATPSKLPTELLTEWKKSGILEPDCFPSKETQEKMQFFRPDIHYSLARIYRKIINQVLDCKHFIFIEYRAHRETLSAMNEILANSKNKKTALFLMSPLDLVDNEEKENIVIIPLWSQSIGAGLGGNEISTLITRLILQVQPDLITNLWSTFFMKSVLKPSLTAFNSLDIKVKNLVFAPDEPDLFSPRFRNEWVDSFSSTSENLEIVLTNQKTVDFLKQRSVGNLNITSLRENSKEKDHPFSKKEILRRDISEESPVEISCILNVHREGNLINPTLRSIEEMIVNTIEQGSSTVELVIVLDCSDEKTRNIVSSYAEKMSFQVRLIEVNNKNLALSRNDGINSATGIYVALLDADDLYGKTWLTAALDELNSSENPERSVVHPQFNVYFGKDRRVFEHKPLEIHDAAVFGMAFTNYWTSLLFSKRKLMVDFPFAAIDFDAGFAFEDWSWNINSLKNGISHLVAPKTAHFIRLKPHGSLNTDSVNAGAIFRPAGLFDESISQG